MNTTKASGHRISELDGLRGIAIVLVMLCHFEGNISAGSGDTSIQRLYLFLIRNLWCGVDLFFVLSGFLITGILLRTREKTSYFKAFYGKRALRILPVALIAITGWFWVAAPALRALHLTSTFGHSIASGADFPSSTQIWYFFFLQNWLLKVPPALGHLWSLAVEEQFYLAWPLLILIFWRRLDKVCIAIVLGSIALRALLISRGLPLELIHRLTFCSIDQLALGSALAFRIHKKESTRLFEQLMVPSLVGLAIIVWVEAASESLGASLMVLFGPMFWGLAFSGLVSMAVRREFARLSAFLTLPFLRSMGQYSYALYVFHFAILIALRQVFRGRFSNFGLEETLMGCIGISTSWAVAWISWNLIEGPIFVLKDRLWPPSPLRAGPYANPSGGAVDRPPLDSRSPTVTSLPTT